MYLDINIIVSTITCWVVFLCRLGRYCSCCLSILLAYVNVGVGRDIVVRDCRISVYLVLYRVLKETEQLAVNMLRVERIWSFSVTVRYATHFFCL